MTEAANAATDEVKQVKSGQSANQDDSPRDHALRWCGLFHYQEDRREAA